MRELQTNHIDIFSNAGALAHRAVSLTPASSGYAPFNIQNLGGTLYAAYALTDPSSPDDVPGPGHGFVDSYDVNGNFLSRIVTQGALNSPWGLVIAPAGFENVGGDLLVGNFGDGTINAYNLTTHASDGPLKNLSNNPIAISGLWALIVGNGGQAGNNNLIYFTAGPNANRWPLRQPASVPNHRHTSDSHAMQSHARKG